MPRRDLSRRTGSRSVRRTILIVCEGMQESFYFQAVKRQFRLSATSIDVVTINRDSEAIIREAVERRNDRATDEAWCVLDTEYPADNPRFPQAVALADRERIGLAVSNPSFEYWLLLHFVYTTRGFTDNDELFNVLKRAYPPYEKNQDCCGALWPHQEQAKANARRVMTEQARLLPAEQFPHPFTTVHLLVEYLASQQ